MGGALGGALGRGFGAAPGRDWLDCFLMFRFHAGLFGEPLGMWACGLV